jgi:hypothetical protein
VHHSLPLLTSFVLCACGARSSLDTELTERGEPTAGKSGRPASAPCDFELSAPVVIKAGDGPQAIAAGDLDGDGWLDLMVANTNTNRLTVSFNRGGREFGSAVSQLVAEPSALALADLDGDDQLDLVTANANGCALHVRLSRRGGAFGDETIYPGGCSSQAIVAADFDGDRRVDIATADNTSATISVFLNQGEGLLTPRVAYDFGSRPASLTTADLDRPDGRLDLVATSWGYLPSKNSSPIVGTFQNVGGGQFQLERSFDVGGAPKAVVAGDFNRDGRTDLVLGHDFEQWVRIYLGAEGGGYAKPMQFQVGLSPAAIASADFDGDGRLDLITADHASSELSFLHGEKSGTFAPRVAYAAVGLPTSLVVRDFDDDGRLDVAVAGFEIGETGVFFGGCKPPR